MPIEFESEEELRAILLHVLKTRRDPSDSQTRELLQIWAEAGERRAEANPEGRLGNILYQRDCARLYQEAGFLEEALEAFRAARFEAVQNGHEELAAELYREMDPFFPSNEGKGGEG